jgi:hypothetical protein
MREQDLRVCRCAATAIMRGLGQEYVSVQRAIGQQVVVRRDVKLSLGVDCDIAHELVLQPAQRLLLHSGGIFVVSEGGAQGR